MPFQPGNTEWQKAQREKPYRDALRLEAKALENGEIIRHPVGSLRAIAQRRLLTADTAEGHADAKEIADRLDGKVPQSHEGSEDGPPIQVAQTVRTIVDPKTGPADG